MKDSKEMLRIVAGSDVPVLLLGESGAGKEVAARFVHRSGPRGRGPFIALNCAAIAAGLMESILEGAINIKDLGEQPRSFKAGLSEDHL